MIATATDLASAGLAENPAVHGAIAALLVLIGLTTYLVRRRRTASRDLDGANDEYGSRPQTTMRRKGNDADEH